MVRCLPRGMSGPDFLPLRLFGSGPYVPAGRIKELRVPRRPAPQPEQTGTGPPLQPPEPPPRPVGRPSSVRPSRPDNPRSATEWVRSNAASSQLDCVPDPSPTSVDSPHLTPTSSSPPEPVLAAHLGTLDEMAEWIADANLPPPPKRKRRRRHRARITSSSDSDVDPAVIEEMRRNITPNPSPASSVPHSPSQATSPPQLPSSVADPVADFADFPHQSTHPPSPPRDDDDLLPLDDYIPSLNDLLTSAAALSDSRWSEFEALLNEITTRIGIVVHLPPLRDESGSSQPTTTDAGDHRKIQRLYKRNRCRAIRLITEGEGTQCHLEGSTIINHFQEVFSPSEHDPAIFRQAAGRSTIPMDPFSPDEVLNVCLRAKRNPSQWKTSRTILIHKKGDNWRPISLRHPLQAPHWMPCIPPHQLALQRGGALRRPKGVPALRWNFRAPLPRLQGDSPDED
ncbi:hypothetical protein JTE90_002355 [Oedothorax gibbosus]|uniref:Uncharacterized protein n=1 Tax=Oedothorax gibbosus TaxID=931172 RepID=A0AAV6ULD7_9ARAC|nr:hypothetical protein JTE90_002355 [Oedothorax gibbosus]